MGLRLKPVSWLGLFFEPLSVNKAWLYAPATLQCGVIMVVELRASDFPKRDTAAVLNEFMIHDIKLRPG